jgi:integrase/recombinase XerD
MPTIAKKRLPMLTAEEVKHVLKACQNPRDKALILVMVDTGLRRAEVCALNWGDIDIASGIVRVKRGKGGKARTVVMGATTRRALLAYRRTVSHDDKSPLFQTKHKGTRFTHSGLRSALLRVGKRAGVHLSPHALRRTFVILSLKAGMGVKFVQGLMGHSTPDMTLYYAQPVEDDLVEAHREHGPIDTFLSKV